MAFIDPVANFEMRCLRVVSGANERLIRSIVTPLLLVFSGFILAGCQLSVNEPTTWYGYVVAEDHRIYMVNLESGELEWVSRVLNRLGDISESEIEINREHSILYISSGSFIPSNHVPLIAVRLNDTADIVFETPQDNGRGSSDNAWSVLLNPDGKSLYVGFQHLHLENDWMSTIVDPLTGEIMGGAPFSLSKNYDFSPDGKLFAFVHPSYTRSRAGAIVKFPATVYVRDLKTGEIVSETELEDNQGMFPPWGSEGDHLVYVRWHGFNNVDVEVYDRESGEQLAGYNLAEALEIGPHGDYTQHHATQIPGSNYVAMTAGGQLVVFNPLTAEIASRTLIFDGALTEVVVTDKPLIRSSN